MKFKFTNASVERLKPSDKRYRVADTDLSGFGLYVYPVGVKTFTLRKRRFQGLDKPIEITIGNFKDPLTCQAARKTAIEYRGLLDKGIDPRKVDQDASDTTLKFRDYAEQFLEETAYRKKAKSLVTEKSLLARHIIPALGKKQLSSITTADISAMMHKIAKPRKVIKEKTGPRGLAIVSGGEATANRCLDIVKALFNHAIRNQLVDRNPTMGVDRFRLEKRERYLTRQEIERLGGVLAAARDAGVNPYAITAIQIIGLSGARKNEILSLKHSYLRPDMGVAQLPDSKTGAKILRLPRVCWELLGTLPQLPGNDWVFPSFKSDGHFTGLQKIWNHVRDEAGISDVRIHDLRHSFASAAVNKGLSLYIVGKALGHARSSTTERYAHLADDPISKGMNEVADDLSVLYIQNS